MHYAEARRADPTAEMTAGCGRNPTADASLSAYARPMALVLGPILRHVGDTTAVIWVQTDAAATVSVLNCSAQTFEVKGFHFALVLVDGLRPGSTYEYDVHVNGERVWPEPGVPGPPSTVRTRDAGGDASRLRLVFGSCRYPRTNESKIDEKLGTDALDAYATRLATQHVEDRPDCLALLGDQVYADELTPEARQHLAGLRKGSRRTKRPADEVVSFGEYQELYRHTWGDPEIRWVLSTVPTAMIFDDHDIRDDWNTSAVWREQMEAVPWWRDRIRAGLASYWVYQHLGNLCPDALRADPDYQKVMASTGDCWPILAEIADRADTEVDGSKGLRFSFRWDMGTSRLIVIDSRNGRILSGGRRQMVGDREFDWLTEQIHDSAAPLDHLILGTSLPWLLPYAVSDMQMINERQAARPGWRGRLGEKIRQAADFEHWPAFFASFTRLTDLIFDIAAGADAPKTISVLSGDVHHSYAARVDMPPDTRTTVHQLVCSPVHNYVPGYVKPVLSYGWSPRVGRLTRAWARRLGVPAIPVGWTNVAGPLFGNTIATLSTDHAQCVATFEQPNATGDLIEVVSVPLTDPDG